MKKFTVGNQKGGVGKTTIDIHLAMYAADQGQKVLVIDLDEGDMAAFFGLKDDADSTQYLMASELYFGGDESHSPRQVAPNIWLIEADVAVLDVDDMDMDIVHNLKRALQRFEDQFDICLIDTPPNLQRRMISALVASDCVVAPFNISPFTFARMPKLMATIENVQDKYNPALKFLGFLPNLVNSRSPDEIDMLPLLRDEYGELMFAEHIIYRPCINKAQGRGNAVWYKPNGSSQRIAGQEMKLACSAVFSKASVV